MQAHFTENSVDDDVFRNASVIGVDGLIEYTYENVTPEDRAEEILADIE